MGRSGRNKKTLAVTIVLLLSVLATVALTHLFTTVITSSTAIEPTAVNPVYQPLTPPTTPAAQNRLPVSILWAGDTMFEREYRRADVDLFARLAESYTGIFERSDMFALNLEGVIAPPAAPVKLYDFAFGDYYADLLKDYGVEVVSLANNHSLDQGTAGYERTVAELTIRGVGSFGHQTKFAAPIYATTTNDRSIAFLGFNLTHPGADKALAQTIVASTSAAYDITIVSVHWGTEYEIYPNPRQVDWGRMFVEAGADAVVGAHPHVMQGMEVYKGVPILYSLGNFVFDQYFSPETRQGLLIELVFSSTSTDVYPIPVTIKHYHPYYATTTAETRIANFLDRSTGIERYIATSTDLIMLRIPAQQ